MPAPGSPTTSISTAGSARLKQFADLPYDLVCFGHTHVPFVERTGSVLVVNPGSPSQPRDRDRRGAYAIFDTETRQAAIHRFCLS